MSARSSVARGSAWTAISPGFIDIHSHAEWLLPDADHGRLVEPFVRQGMTTLVAGNCRFSPAPISARLRYELLRHTLASQGCFARGNPGGR